METIEMLEKEVATLQNRAADLDAEYSRALTTRDAAQEALISSSGTTGTLTQGQTTVQALSEARAEIERRIAAKLRAVAAEKAAVERAEKIAELENAGAEYNAMREALFAHARVLAETFNSGIPALLDGTKQLHKLQLRVVNLAREIEGQEPPATDEYFVTYRQIVDLASDLTAQRSFSAAIDMRREWNNQLAQSRQHEQNHALGLDTRTHQGEGSAQIVETHVISNAEAITRILDGKATLTRF